MRILVVNFFPAFHPPRSGGEQRYYYLYHHLSRHFDVTLLSPTYSNHPPEVVTYGATFREHRVPKDEVFDRLHWQLDAEQIGPECSGYVVALAAGTETEFGRRFQALVADHDVIIHESPFTLPYDRTFGEDGKPRIYNAYNIESRLFAQMFRGEAGRKAVEFIRFLEASLVAASSLTFATCEEERRLFITDFGIDPARTALAPNGFEPSVGDASPAEPAARHGGAPYAVFMGSAHPPNVEAARFIVERVAPALADLEFRMMGAVCEHLPATLPRNVKRLGFVAEADKRRQLEGCAAALNPLFSGAGTNLKMLDYMAAAAPVVSTPVGARGLELEHRRDAFISEGGAFVETLRAVAADPATARAVGAAARRKAFANYTWERIADRVHDAIRSTLGADGSRTGAVRPLLLVLNDFPVAQATNGGQVRIRELLTELGREFEVVLLCLTAERHRHERRIAGGFTEVGIPKTAEHREVEARARRDSAVSIDDLVAADCCTSNPELLAAFHGLAARAATIVFEHPYLAPLLEFVPAGVPVIYSSLNVESDLKAATLGPRADAAGRIARVIELETRLLDRADLVICVCDGDRERFRRTHPDHRYEVIVSGARVEPQDVTLATGSAIADALRGRPLAVFIGSGHTPNIAAARFLVDVAAPSLPDVTFGLIGSVCHALGADALPRNVLRFGLLPEAEKSVLLAHATLAVNPLFEGGGSSLKVADFLAAGLPLVSTRIGVRGYDVRDGEHYLAAGHDDFIAVTRRLAEDGDLRRALAENARAYCESVLDWRLLGARYRRVLRSLIGRATGPRTLVVTYRFADPPPAGAETFLTNVLRELGRRGNLNVDLATCDVGAITNKWHFSAQYDPAPATADPSYVGAAYRFAVDPAHVADFGHCARLFSVWMAESREQAARLLRHFDGPLLLGGWNYPETYGGVVARWTSREAQVFVGPTATAIRLAAVPPQSTRVEVHRGDGPIASRAVGERFEWEVDLPGDAPIVSVRVAQAFVARDDPRELGMLALEVSVRDGGRWVAIDLRDDFADTMRRRSPAVWVQSLIDVAEHRDGFDDDLFVAVRGPHSREMRRWLEDNVASYDVVLAQGVPFATSVEATEIATLQGVPVVILPHFHMEDRYYHWRRYYDAFRRARCVIASSAATKALVFDAIGAASVVLPGGGVDLAEYDDDGRAGRQRAFRAVHPSTTPFVLVLGRKAGSKNYRMAIDAIASVNRAGHRVDLVLIGPDDDRAPITAPHTYYYGARERDVVLGALSLSLCLVNMSESESFGIVLLESWLSARPVIAQRRCMAFADLVVPGENGFLAESAEEVAAAIASYLADADLAARHGERGKALAGDYSWVQLAERIEGVLSEAAVPATVGATARDYHV